MYTEKDLFDLTYNYVEEAQINNANADEKIYNACFDYMTAMEPTAATIELLLNFFNKSTHK